ncbi:MAG: hypothetical protein VXV76_04620 [Candidatus Thermoplasmatota archaeon]|nr:hypothetical protein [Candidatus Thermoplasmatota archaeon]
MRRNSRVERLEREIQRLRTSPSLRLGSHITDAIKKPWRAPFLIITLPIHMLIIGLELIGFRPQPKSLSKNSEGRLATKGDCVIMFPTNGVGFGHFTRMLAIAKRMKKLNSNLEIIFFTTMPTLHILKRYDIPAHHISGPKYFKGMSSEDWNALLEEELTLCFETHKPSMFIFDGAFPYRGMLRAIEGKSTMSKIWLRRGMFRKGASIPVDSIQHFDSIIRPMDSINETSEEVNHELEIITSPPIVLLDENEMLSKEDVRASLQLPRDATVVYVQLGAGEINDINSEIRITVENLISRENLFVVIGESMIGERLSINLPNVKIIRDYPNSMYFRGFDAVISAGGYNSYHEARNLGIPTLFYPNLNTGMDDQSSRCEVAKKEGWGLTLKDRNVKNINKSIDDLIAKISQPRPIIEKSQGAKNLAEILNSRIGD